MRTTHANEEVANRFLLHLNYSQATLRLHAPDLLHNFLHKMHCDNPRVNQNHILMLLK